MKLPIGDTYIIQTDKHNFNVLQYSKRTDPRTKKESWSWGDEKHFGKLDHALNYILECEIKRQDKLDIQELKDLIIDTRKQFKQIVEQYGLSLKHINSLDTKESKENV